MGRVENKVAVVTGGGSGIGRASSLLLAREGAAVVVADLDGTRPRSWSRRSRPTEAGRSAQQADIGEEDQVKVMVDRAVESSAAMHILFNNAADTSLDAMILDKPIHEMSVEWWDHAMRVDLRGAMLGCKHAIPHMMEAGGGSIVSTASNQGLVGRSHPGRVRVSPRPVWCS